MQAPIETERIDYRESLSGKEKMVILLGVLLTLFLAALDQTIVGTAQPAIIAQFQGIDLISWVTSGYLLASTAMVPIFGKLSDLYGRKWVLMVGAVIFLIGSALCGTAPSMLLLIIYRVIQGVGAAGITSVAFAIPADLWAPAERAKVSGLITSVFGLAGIVGPFLGGLLTDQISWRAVFYVNVPIGIVALIFAAIKMPRMASGVRQPIDWAGTVTLLTAVIPLLLAVTLDKSLYAWSSLTILGLFAVAGISTLLFILVEARAQSPILPLGLFRDRTFTVASLASLTFGAAFFGAILYLAIFMVGVLGVSATKAGGALMPMMIGLVMGAVVASAGTQRTGRYKPFLIGGIILTGIGLWLMSRMSVETTLFGVTWRMVFLGVGVGPMAPLLSLSITNSVPFAQVGAASASRAFFQNIGQTLAVAIFGVIMSTNLSTEMAAKLQPIVAELPPAFQGRFDMSQMKNGASAEGGEGVPDVGAKIKVEITKVFAEQRSLVTAAIKANDAAAQAKLMATPEIPAELKAVVAPGGLERIVAGQMGAQWAQIPDATKAQILAQAREKALTQALARLDEMEQSLLQQGEVAGAKITTAIKESFAAATTPIYGDAVWVALASLLALLFLPELPLSRGKQAAVAVGH